MIPDLADQVDDAHEDLVQVAVLQHLAVVHDDPLEAGVGDPADVVRKLETVAHGLKSDVSEMINLNRKWNIIQIEIFFHIFFCSYIIEANVSLPF